jgi:hypothetical protein
MERKYQIAQDDHRRWGAQVTQNIHVAIRILPETDEYRVSRGVHAHAVVTVKTDIGPLRIRFIHVAKTKPRFDGVEQPEFKVRWLSKRTGQRTETGGDEYLDVCGPLDAQTRRIFNEHILGVFGQVREMASKGDLYCGNRTDGFEE